MVFKSVIMSKPRIILFKYLLNMTIILIKSEEKIDRFRKITIIHVTKSMREGKRKRRKDQKLTERTLHAALVFFSAKPWQVELILLLVERDRAKDMGS